MLVAQNSDICLGYVVILFNWYRYKKVVFWLFYQINDNGNNSMDIKAKQLRPNSYAGLMSAALILRAWISVSYLCGEKTYI